mmetsp:Transcript_10091/g.35941  ORF Transcript_10091/g.35941 Transcript_10091/m.35941 type:complete len:97 (-) Transcript_10091:60-350(-)
MLHMSDLGSSNSPNVSLRSNRYNSSFGCRHFHNHVQLGWMFSQLESGTHGQWIFQGSKRKRLSGPASSCTHVHTQVGWTPAQQITCVLPRGGAAPS